METAVDIDGAKNEVSYVAVPSTPQERTSDASNVLKTSEALQDLNQDLTNEPLHIPDAKFTAPLLTSWAISLIASIQCGYSFAITGAIKEKEVLPGHSRFQWSVFVSSLSVGALIGARIAGQVGTAWARKRGVLLSTSLYLAGGVIMAFAANIYMLIVGRFCIGLGAGGTGIFVPLYIRELSAPNLRGTLGTGYQMTGAMGGFICCLLAFAFAGTYHNVFHPGWRMLVGFHIVFSVLQILLMPFLPESPCWLVRATRMDDARTVLVKLRGTEDVSIELRCIQAGLEQDKRNQMTLKEVFCDRSIRRLLVVGCVLPLMQQLSGFSAVTFYGNQFFKNAGLQNPLVGTALVATVNFCFVCVALVLMDRAGRRPLLISSCCGMIASQLVLTMALLGVLPAAKVLSVAGALCFVAFYESGMGPIAWLLVPEMLPPVPRAHVQSISTMLQWLCSFTVGLVFPIMQADFNNLSFVPFTVCLICSLIFSINFVPETKGKTVEEIRAGLPHHRRAKN